jgi:hypothetical protein
MNIEQEIQNILDRNFTRGDNANALKELLVLYNVVGLSEQLLALAQYMCEHHSNLDGKTAKDYLQDFLSQ